MSEVMGLTSRGQKSEGQRSAVKSQGSKFRGHGSEFMSRGSRVDQRPRVRSKEFEVRGHGANIRGQVRGGGVRRQMTCNPVVVQRRREGEGRREAQRPDVGPVTVYMVHIYRSENVYSALSGYIMNKIECLIKVTHRPALCIQSVASGQCPKNCNRAWVSEWKTRTPKRRLEWKMWIKMWDKLDLCRKL